MNSINALTPPLNTYSPPPPEEKNDKTFADILDSQKKIIKVKTLNKLCMLGTIAIHLSELSLSEE